MPDDETEQLADEGYECLWDGDLDRVLEIADILKERRYSAWFELRGRDERLVTCYYVNASTPENAIEDIREVETVLDSTSLELAQWEDITDDEERPHYPYGGVVCRAMPYEKDAPEDSQDWEDDSDSTRIG